jgi:hypothetical protein
MMTRTMIMIWTSILRLVLPRLSLLLLGHLGPFANPVAAISVSLAALQVGAEEVEGEARLAALAVDALVPGAIVSVLDAKKTKTMMRMMTMMMMMTRIVRLRQIRSVIRSVQRSPAALSAIRTWAVIVQPRQ